MNRVFVGLILITLTTSKEDRISDYRLCGDPECSKPVSLGRTLIHYSSDDKRILSFKSGVLVEIYSKSAGSQPDLWGAKIDGKRGYIPKGLVRENKVLKKDLNYRVPTEYNVLADSDKDKENAAKSTDDKDVNAKSVEDREIQTKSVGLGENEISTNHTDGKEIVLESTHDTKNKTGREIADNDASISQTIKSSSTPSLATQIPPASINIGTFSLKGVSAESPESKPPTPDSVVKPYEVVDGTTLFYSTDGETENSGVPEVTATSVYRDTTPSVSLDSLSVKHKDGSEPDRDPKLTSAADVKLSDQTKAGSRVSLGENEILTDKEVAYNDKKSNEKSETNLVMEDTNGLVSDDYGDDDEEDDDGEDGDGDDNEADESGEDQDDIDDEIGEASDTLKAMDSDIQEVKLRTSEGNASVPEESFSKSDTDDKTQNEKIPETPTSQSALPALETSNVQPHKIVLLDTIKKNESDISEKIGLDGDSPSEYGEPSQNIKLEVATPEIRDGDVSEVSEELLLKSVSSKEYDDELILVEKNVTSPNSASNESDVKMSEELLDSYENVLSGDESLLADTLVQGKTATEVVTEVPVDEGEAVPPVDYVTTTENPLSSEGMISAEDTSGKSEGSSSEEFTGDGDRSSNEDEKSSQDVQESSDLKVEEAHVENIESNKLAFTENIITSSSAPEGGAATTEEPTEHKDDSSDLGTGSETEQKFKLGDETVEENIDSDHRPSDSTVEQVNSDIHSEIVTEDDSSAVLFSGDQSSDSTVEQESRGVLSGTTTEDDSSAGLFSGVADTLLHSYENVLGLFWSATSEEPAVTENVDATTSRPAEDMSSDKENQDTDTDPAGGNQSVEKVGDIVGETSGTNTSSQSSIWEPSDTKESPPQNTPQTAPESSDVCHLDPGVDGPCAELRRTRSVMDPYSSMRKLQQEMEHMHTAEEEEVYLSAPNNTIWFVMSTGVLVTLFTLGFIYLEKSKFHRSLIVEVNALKKALQIKSLESMPISRNDEEIQEEHNSEELHATVTSLQQQLQDSQERCAELEEKVLGLEKELETATETGLELNKMLGDMLSSQQDSDELVHNMEDLRRQLDTQEAAMKADLAAKTAENEKLQLQMDKVLERNSLLDEELQKLKETFSKTVTKLQELQKQNELIQTQFSEEQQQVEKLSQELQVVRQTLEEVNQALAIKDSEVTVLQDCLKQTRAGEGEEEGIDKFQALLDVGHVRAELKMVSLERDALSDRLRGEEGARKLLEDHVELVTKEVEKLRSRYEEAEKEKLEAQTRLEVLSNYFKEKETQLQKELGLQEAMNLQKDGDVVTTFERIRLLQDEVENYKSQVDTLKKEILDQERGLKSQISALEKKAHENWVAARQAERRLEDSKQEAGQLRNRLTIVEKNLTNTSTPNGDTSLKMTERLTSESNGELPMSPPLIDSPLHYRDGLPVSPPLIPPFMLPPPGVPFMPPPAFMPPPPPPMFPGDRRPPPLGRMSSPPPHFSPPPPPSDYSPSYDERSEDRTPPPYHSPVHFDNLDRYRRRTPPRWDQPVGPRSGFRPLPPNLRTTTREPKGSAVSSGHSSESLEKSSRHSDNNMV